MRDLLNKEQGFTLIEIVLVLAIAGLILLMVFLAVSGAQKSRRDTQRKQDVSRISSQLESFASNNDGAYPTAVNLAAFEATYLAPQSNYEDPSSGAWYGAHITYGILVPATPGYIEYSTGEICNGGIMAAAPNGNTRDYAAVIDLEQGTDCVSNY